MSESTPELGKKIRSGTKWTLTGSVAGEVLGFAIGILLARLLLPKDFGMVATVGIVTGIAGYFTGAGTGQALVRAKEIDQQHFNVVFTLQLAIACVIYLIFLIIAPLFASYFGEPMYKSLLLVSGLNFFIRPFVSLPSARLQREMQFRSPIIIGLTTTVIGSTLSIVLALLGYGPWSLIFSGLSGSLINAFLLSLSVRQKYALAWDRAIAKDLGGYGIKVVANNLLEYYRGQFLLLILSKLRGPGDVGLYNRASSLAQVPMRIVGSSPYQAVFRALASEQDNLDKSRYIYYRTITLVTTYTLPLYVMAWWLAEPGIRFIYGERWLGSAEPLAILALTGLFRCIGNPSGAVIEARNRMSTETKLNVAAWVILVPGAIYGLKWGLVGVAWAAAGTLIFFCSSLAIVAGRELKGTFGALVKALWPSLVLNALLFAVLWVTDAFFLGADAQSSPGLYSMLMACIGGAVYVAAFLFLPIESLKTESAKWRIKLRLSNQ